MIILIGGAGCTGKTMLAQRLMERYQIPYMSADHVKMGLVRGWENCPFTPCDGDETIARYLWTVLEGVVRTNVENEQHLILEGCYIPPEHAVALEKEFPGIVFAVYPVFSREYVMRAYKDGIVAHRSDLEKRGYDEERTPEEIAREHECVCEACRKAGARCVEIDDDHARGMAQVIAMTDAFVRAADKRKSEKKFEKSEKNA